MQNQLFPGKKTSVEAAIKYYGAIDMAAMKWPGESVWLKMLEMPKDLLANFPNWKVLTTQIPVTHIAANRDIHQPLLGALSAAANQGLGDKLLTFDGCFNIRPVRGNPGAISAHSYALAIDLNADTNRLGQETGGFFDLPELVKCFTDQGFDWGGNFHDRKDPMHFSYCWEGVKPEFPPLP